ncbi:MAG TPA: hypothetical protein VHF26_13510 [Trebonia sp.]|nr:hypothetical protein [Trebonia sp.]
MLCYARRLRDIEDGLKASEPRLAAKYAIFNELTAADGPARTETLRGPALMRRAADSGGMAARVAAVVVLLAVVVSGLVIGTLLQPAARPCASPASSSQTSSSQTAGVQTTEVQALSEVAASAAVMPPGAAGRCGAYVGR